MTSMKNVQCLHPPLPLFSVCPNGPETKLRLPTTPPPTPPTPHPYLLWYSCKKLFGKEFEEHTMLGSVIYNEKHVKSSSMSTLLIRLLQIVRNCPKQESIYVFNLYFCSSVLVSQSILIEVSITYHAHASHNSLQLKINLN